MAKGLKPPYYKNPNQDLEQTRANMNPKVNDPTINTFTSLSTTDDTSFNNNDEVEIPAQKRPSVEGKLNLSEWFKNNWIESILSAAIFFIVAFIYNFNSRASVIENNIEHQNSKIEENSNDVENSKEKINTLANDYNLIKYRLDKIENSSGNDVKPNQKN